MHDGGRLDSAAFRAHWLLLKPFLLFAGRARATDLNWPGLDGHPRVGRAHHFVRDTVRLMLQRIIDRSDSEFRLNGTREARRRKKRRHLKLFRTTRRKDWDLAR